MPRIGRALLLGSGGSGLGYLAYRAFLTPDGLDGNNYGAVRFGRAALTVGKIGIDYKKTLNSVNREDDAEYAKSLSECHVRSANELLALCRANGGVFVKVGQHIGALDYLLPEEYVRTMKVLHNRAPKMEMRDIYAVLREDLNVEPQQLFSEFDEDPLGTASLAQVHRARLRENNREVAVKVQHRFVKNHSFVDIYTCDFLVHTVKFFFPQFEFMWLAEEMRKNLPLELSFLQEGRNAEKVSNMFSHYDWLKVPEIYWKYSTDRVLTMEYCPGTHINDVYGLRRNGVNNASVSKKISQMYADMIFKEGYVHCDPHPGNVLVRKDSNGTDQVVLLDHGLYTQLTNDFRINYSKFWLSILNADTEGIKVQADKLGVGALYGLFACMVAGRSWDSITKGIDRAEKTEAESQEIKENVGRYLKEITDVLAFVNRQMILIFKTNDLLRTIEFNLGTQNNMSFFINMSRACFRCLDGEQLRASRGRFQHGVVKFKYHYHQFKITLYQVFLWFWFSKIGIRSRNIWRSLGRQAPA